MIIFYTRIRNKDIEYCSNISIIVHFQRSLIIYADNIKKYYGYSVGHSETAGVAKRFSSFHKSQGRVI
jgi:hypothetical protein